ncbi:hypothetical protein V8C44DRAFT_313840 [Trichoderma aethiopicum]
MAQFRLRPSHSSTPQHLHLTSNPSRAAHAHSSSRSKVTFRDRNSPPHLTSPKAHAPEPSCGRLALPRQHASSLQQDMRTSFFILGIVSIWGLLYLAVNARSITAATQPTLYQSVAVDCDKMQDNSSKINIKGASLTPRRSPTEAVGYVLSCLMLSYVVLSRLLCLAPLPFEERLGAS